MLEGRFRVHPGTSSVC